jgi:hypothetical protein
VGADREDRTFDPGDLVTVGRRRGVVREVTPMFSGRELRLVIDIVA